jgi:hypothetical protein
MCLSLIVFSYSLYQSQFRGEPIETFWRDDSPLPQDAIRIGWTNGNNDSTIYKLDLKNRLWQGITYWTTVPHSSAGEAVRLDCYPNGEHKGVVGGDSGSALTANQIVNLRKWAEILPPADDPSNSNVTMKVIISHKGKETVYWFTRSRGMRLQESLAQILGRS